MSEKTGSDPGTTPPAAGPARGEETPPEQERPGAEAQGDDASRETDDRRAEDPAAAMAAAWVRSAQAAGSLMENMLEVAARSAAVLAQGAQSAAFAGARAAEQGAAAAVAEVRGAAEAADAGDAAQSGAAQAGKPQDGGTGRVGSAAAAGAAPPDPVASARAVLARFSEGLAEMGALQAKLLSEMATGAVAGAPERTDAATFSQLGRLAGAHLDEELRRLSEVPAALAERLANADPERLSGLLQSMLAEYAADLEALRGAAGTVKLEPLAEAFGKLAAGAADPEARKVAERLGAALAVKARYGPEYYADPEGTPVGQTPRQRVHREGKIQLFRYGRRPESAPGGAARSAAGADAASRSEDAGLVFNEDGVPVLIIYSVINRPYILDLTPGNSFIEHLLAEGLDPYLIEWGETEPGDRTTTLDSYIEPGISGCVEAIRRLRGVDRVALFGHCIGGNLALLYAGRHPERVSALITLTTPITAAEGGVVAVWTDRDVLPIDAILDAYGHMPAKLIRYTFIALKPYYEVLKWKMFLEGVASDETMALFYPVDRWANDNVDIPGAVFQKFIEEVFHRDRFRRGETRIHGESVRLERITCPVMNLAASRDWIVPPASARVLGEHVGSEDYEYVEIPGAHVAILIDPRCRPLWSRMSDFLRSRGGAPGAAGEAPRPPAGG